MFDASDIPELAGEVEAELAQLHRHGHDPKATAELIVRNALAKAFVSGIRLYAHWEQGVERVGTCGMTFVEARDEVIAQANVSPKAVLTVGLTRSD